MIFQKIERELVRMLGVRIAMLRKGAGMSQATLAKQLHISPSTLGSYEQGRREPSCTMLVALANVFDVSVDYLLTGHLYNHESLADNLEIANHLVLKVSKKLIVIQSSEDVGVPLIEFLPEE